MTASAIATEPKRTFAKPFLKWAGGKTQLLEEISKRLPREIWTGKIETYVEPFVGGGAVFFYIAQNCATIERFYLLDINEDLVNCYKAIKERPDSVVRQLGELSSQFLPLPSLERRIFYYRTREQFNQDRSPAKLIFLNRTCYNGLYRVNRKNEFNVPFGDYKNPRVCDSDNLIAVSRVLKGTEIICGDFEESAKYIDNHTFIYLDPPYRPLTGTASFTSYSRDNFTEQDQVRLAKFCARIAAMGGKFLLSNSDPTNKDPADDFFERSYRDFNIERVKAIRAINCKGSRRGEINELLITRY